MSSWGHLVAGLATVWTLGLWATVQEIGRRRRSLDAAAPAPAPTSGWPLLVCACPLDGGDAADAFDVPSTGNAGGALSGLWAYPGALRLVFLAAEDDPAAQGRAHAHAGAWRARGYEASAVVTRVNGRNRKASQLAQVSLEPESCDARTCLLTLDSDVAPHTVDAQQLVARLLEDTRTGLVWQPAAVTPRGRTCGDFVTSAVLGAGALTMPLLAALDANSPVGKVMAFRAQALARAGGWAAVQQELGDDVALGVRLHRAGYAVTALAGAPAVAPRRGQTLRGVCRRLLRWQTVVRAQRPKLLWSYPLYLAFLPTLLVLWAVAAHGGAPRAWAAMGAAMALVTRLQLAVVARRSCRHAWRAPSLVVDVFVGDLVVLALFVGGAWRRGAHWNGRAWGQAPCTEPAHGPLK